MKCMSPKQQTSAKSKAQKPSRNDGWTVLSWDDLAELAGSRSVDRGRPSATMPHYHIHAVVPGGGLSADHQRWIPTSHPMFLVPVPVLRTVFRNKFLVGLRQFYRKGRLNLRAPAAPLRDPSAFDQLNP
jgi:hypothetical protein